MLVDRDGWIKLQTMSQLKNISGVHFEHVPVNVYDIKTKEIVFTGSQIDAANFIGVQRGYLSYYLKTKARIKKKWAIRYAKQSQ
jgi:hypothetical protein